jgi:hypothetical protein
MEGSYYEGNLLDPDGKSGYPVKMNYKGKKLNSLYVCCLECLEPYINSQVDVLEIGAGILVLCNIEFESKISHLC